MDILYLGSSRRRKWDCTQEVTSNMSNMISFFRREFPAKKRTIFYGLCNGALLVAILWYPLPMLLEKLNPSSSVSYAIALVLVCILVGSLLSGKGIEKDNGMIGWTAVGLFLSGIILVVFSHGEFWGSLIAGICALALYIVAALIKEWSHK